MIARPERSRFATGGGYDRDAAVLVGVGGLCAAVVAVAVALTFANGSWAAGIALAMLLLVAGACFALCAARLPWRRK